MANLIYISNTRVPSNKANTYQSFCMCEAFANLFDSVEFWHPSRKGDYASVARSLSDEIDKVFFDYEISKNFKLKRLSSIDAPWISRISSRLWFYLEAVSFSASCLLSVIKAPDDSIVFTRDSVTLSLLSFLKRRGLIKKKVFFEAHKFSEREARLSKYIDGVVAINNYLKELYGEEGRHHVLVAHDGVKQVELSLSKNSYSKSKRGDKLILYSGNMFPWKGVHTLADCVEYLPAEYKVIFLGGSHDTLPAFKSYVMGRNGIEVLGFRQRNEVRAYLDEADVLVLPNSPKDPMSSYTSPLKLFEYMAARKPIVASRIPSLEEILQDGINAVLFNPDDPRDLAEKIKWVVSNDCSSIVDQAWNDVQAYTWNKRADKIFSWMRGDGYLVDSKVKQTANKEKIA